jgi:peptidoglycan/LPS O-acetylase OafA/YrhL
MPGAGAWAAIGVEVFFVLSGFLITWLLLEEYDATGTVSLRRFYTRRALRIFPAYYVYLGVTAVALWLLPVGRPSGEWLAAVTYTHNYYRAVETMGPHPLYHLWSLAAEEQFYLLWPVALVFLLRRGGRHLVQVALATVLVGVLGWRLLLIHGLDAPLGYVRFAFETRADTLAAGCLLAVGRGSDWYRWIERRATWRAPIVTGLAILFATALLTIPRHYAWAHTANAALCSLLFVQVLSVAGTQSWRWLDSATMRHLGTLSYPLYLWHLWALMIGGAVATEPASQFAVGIIFALVFATASYRFIERPALRLRDRWAPRQHGISQ